MSAIDISCPSRAKRQAIARPIPCPPPVMKAIRPSAAFAGEAIAMNYGKKKGNVQASAVAMNSKTR